MTYLQNRGEDGLCGEGGKETKGNSALDETARGGAEMPEVGIQVNSAKLG